jgi:hypothetical protein
MPASKLHLYTCPHTAWIVRNINVKDSSVRACALEDSIVERSVIEGIRVNSPHGGKRMPTMLWGVLVCQVVLKGKTGALVWNPSRTTASSRRESSSAARKFYRSVDRALDITEARFTSVPSLRFGPPGHLIRPRCRDAPGEPEP